MSFRKLLFWLHLLAGVVFGIIVGIMCVTGTLIAFEHELVAWAERDVRRVEPPSPEAQPLALDVLLAQAREAQPELKPAAVTVKADRREAVALQLGRQGRAYVDPYTATLRPEGAQGLRSFLHTMEDWHRWLGAHGDNRPLGKSATGISNLAFLVLLLTGLYLWVPRRWTRKALRPSIWFVKARGKARDWNWHNVIGLWTAPVLLVLIVSAVPISYQWAGNLVYRLVGEEPPPPRQGPPGRGGPPPPMLQRPDGAALLPLQEVRERAAAEYPRWTEITLRLSDGATESAAPAHALTIKEGGAWPLFASTQASVHPFTGELISATGFGDQTTGRQARSWLRFLHTGEAFGFGGKLVAALVSAGGAVLVWTGFAMAWVRLRNWRGRRARA